MPYMVMVRCPEVDTAVPTGIRCEISGFSSLSARVLECPGCGQAHRWSIDDAWLRDTAFATAQPPASGVAGAGSLQSPFPSRSVTAEA
jgi:hypothetical protein